METLDIESTKTGNWELAFAQLLQKEPASPMKKSTAPRQHAKSTLTVGRIVRRIESSSISLSDAARIKAALAGFAHNLVLTPGAIDRLITTTGVNENELLKILGLPIYPW
jgi:hypothetical protein